MVILCSPELCFQVFFCLGCSPIDGDSSSLALVPRAAMVASLEGLAALALAQANTPLTSLPAKLRSQVEAFTEEGEWGEGLEEVEVARWEELVQEIPSLTELREQGMEGEVEAAGVTMEELEELEGEEGELGEVEWPHPGVKLGGWVRWCQGVEYPRCGGCGEGLVVPGLQLEQGPLLAWGWGDAGTAHVTSCPSCARPGLGWACC